MGSCVSSTTNKQVIIQRKLKKQQLNPDPAPQPLQKIPESSQNTQKNQQKDQNIQQKEQKKCTQPCCQSYYIQRQKLNISENQFLEYKDYLYPFTHRSQIENIRKSICGFLNTKGGCLLIGIKDTDQEIKGVKLSTKDKDDLKLKFQNQIFELYYPKINRQVDQEVSVDFIPLQNAENNNQWLYQTYVIRIKVNQGIQKDRLYFIQDKAYIRQDGMTKQLQNNEKYEILCQRAQKPVDNIIPHNFIDPDPQGLQQASLQYKQLPQNVQNNNNHLNNNNNQSNSNSGNIEDSSQNSQKNKVYKTNYDSELIEFPDSDELYQQKKKKQYNNNTNKKKKNKKKHTDNSSNNNNTSNKNKNSDQNSNNNNQKEQTVICRNFLKGKCKYGQNCKFKHTQLYKPQEPDQNSQNNKQNYQNQPESQQKQKQTYQENGQQDI